MPLAWVIGRVKELWNPMCTSGPAVILGETSNFPLYYHKLHLIFLFFLIFITSPSYICKFLQEIDDCDLV